MKCSDLPSRTRTYEELLAEAEPTMKAVIYSQIRCPGDREETLQESRIDLWKAHSLYAGEIFSGRSLGKVIARRRCTKYRQKTECRTRHERAYAHEKGFPTHRDDGAVVLEVIFSEEAKVLRKAFGFILKYLPPVRRQVFEAYFLEGLTLQQIADRHGWSAKTSARYHVVKSIEAIKAHLTATEMDCLGEFCPSRPIGAGRWLTAA